MQSMFPFLEHQPDGKLLKALEEWVAADHWIVWFLVMRLSALECCPAAIRAAHILQLSGVGDPEHLGHIGVLVVHELRGVGKNPAGPLCRASLLSSRRRADRRSAFARTLKQRSHTVLYLSEVSFSNTYEVIFSAYAF
jgi:hypothetical protein